MRFSALARSLPQDFQIILADVGSAGGLHKRWSCIRDHVTAVLFDPLDDSVGSERDRYFPVALAGAEGKLTLNVTKRISMTSALQPSAPLLSRFWDKPEHTRIVSTQEVPTRTFDQITQSNDIHLDVLKIDVQGGEYDILASAHATLTSSLFLAEVEVSFLERYQGLKTFDHVIALMRDTGFDLIDIGRIKRYRYRNSFGIVNPGLGRGDRAGRLAFCDAVFMLRDERLLQRISENYQNNGPYLALKVIIVLLIYGKADLAAWIFDAARDHIPVQAQGPLKQLFKNLKGKHFGLKGLHKALDYLARKV
ncbi:MAG: FkbM family methyltransferase [Sphingomonadaceae bacterium]